MIYLDNAATTLFKPPAVVEAVSYALTVASGNPGRSGHKAAIDASLLIHRARERAAEFFGCEADRIIFTGGCTDALNLALLGTIRRGNVVTSVLEHNSILRPLFELERLGRITLTIIEPDESGTISPKTLQNALRDDTYLVALTHISNVTGAQNPIAEIGKMLSRRDTLFLVDAAQSAGHVEVRLDKSNIDMLAVAAHKGLHGAQGAGLLALSSRVRLEPVRFGGTGTGSESVYQPLSYPEGFESGTPPTPAIAGLGAAIEFTADNMRSADKAAALGARLVDGLSRNKRVKLLTRRNTPTTVVAFNIDGYDSAEVSNILDTDYDIAVRGGLHCAPLTHKYYNTLKTGAVRASLSSFSTQNDIIALLTAVAELCG